MTDPLTASSEKLDVLLQQSAALHRHLCPRQVLGARMGLLAGDLLDISVPQPRKQLLTIVETDGCFADGVAVATNCWLGRRTLRLQDYGKVAATFIDCKSERAVRIYPHPEARTRSRQYAPEARNRWQAYLDGYQRMPVAELLIAEWVTLRASIADIISRNGIRVNCTVCGEEVINGRELRRHNQIFCLACADDPYYDRSG